MPTLALSPLEDVQSASVDEILVAAHSGASTQPEISMVGDRIAIGKPGKSKAKTDKRVRYITCRVCHLLFFKRDQYREHMRVHANDPNITIYSCDYCKFVTKRRGVFNTHVLRHTGDLPFKCNICSYAARQNSLLKQHMTNKHPDVPKDISIVMPATSNSMTMFSTNSNGDSVVVRDDLPVKQELELNILPEVIAVQSGGLDF